MLTLNLSPVRTDRKPLAANYAAPILTLDCIDYDLSEIPDGASIRHPILMDGSRDGEDYELTIRFPHGANAPEEARFPDPVVVSVDGPIDLPAYDLNPETGEVTL